MQKFQKFHTGEALHVFIDIFKYAVHIVRVTVQIHNAIDLHFDIIKNVTPVYTSNKEFAVFVNLDESDGN